MLLNRFPLTFLKSSFHLECFSSGPEGHLVLIFEFLGPRNRDFEKKTHGMDFFDARDVGRVVRVLGLDLSIYLY